MSDPEIVEFARVRVESRRHGLSVTADIAFDSWLKVNPYDLAAKSTCDMFVVSYVGHPVDGLPTFLISEVGDESRDPQALLRLAKVRIEDAFDGALGEQLIR